MQQAPNLRIVLLEVCDLTSAAGDISRGWLKCDLT